MADRRSRWTIGGTVLALAIGAGILTLSRVATSNVARAETPAKAPSVLRTTPSARVATGAPEDEVPEHAAKTAPAGEVVFHAAWGGQLGELGRQGGDESSPEGPMSFVVDAKGRAIVLDQVNARLEIFENGEATRTVPLHSETFQDVAVNGDGWVLLDRSGDEAVAFVGADGKLSHEVALRGSGVDEGGSVTALAQRDDGTWVETKHQEWVRIADADGHADAARPIASGRFAPDGASLRLARAGGAKASLVRTMNGDAAVRWLEFDGPIWALNALEVDGAGRIFVGAELATESEAAPFQTIDRSEEILVLDPSGAEIARLSLPPSTGAEETFRSLRVGPDGALYQLVFEPTGPTMRRYSL
jgi:hypothetical protein